MKTDTNGNIKTGSKNRKHKKLIIILAVLFVLVLTAGALYFFRNKMSSKAAVVQNYMVTSETYENVIEISGVVKAAQEQTLQALSSGTVMGVFVKQGDYVKKGDVILQLDDSNEQYSLEKHDYDMAQTRINGSARELQLMETQRKALLQKISDRKVTASFDGIIADLDVAAGQSVDAKDSIGTIVDVTSLIAEVEVTETDVAKLKIGQKVIFSFPAYNGRVEGYVTGWPTMGSVTNRGATVVRVKVRIDDYPEVILPNFSFSGKIEVSPSETYTLVNKYAVGREDGQAYVQDARTGEKKNVTVVPYDTDYVKIVEGEVKAGDMLVGLTTAARSGSSRTGSQARGNMGGMGGFGGSAGGSSGSSSRGSFGGMGGAGAGAPPSGF